MSDNLNNTALNKESSLLKFIKNKKIIFSIVTVILLIATICIISSAANKNKVKNQLIDYYENECGLEKVTITLKKSNDEYNLYDYYAYIECSNLSDFSYEEMTRFEYYLNVDGVDVKNYKSNGDTYIIFTTSVYKNGEEVYEKKSSSSHKCIECGASASKSYKSPFSGQTEWYCSSCYRELQDLLDQFGIN